MKEKKLVDWLVILYLKMTQWKGWRSLLDLLKETTLVDWLSKLDLLTEKKLVDPLVETTLEQQIEMKSLSMMD